MSLTQEREIATGWFGVPFGKSGHCPATKVHIVRDGKPVCGVRISEDMEFQFCAWGAELRYVECERCKTTDLARKYGFDQ